MSYTAVIFNDASVGAQEQAVSARRKTRSGRGGGTVLKAIGVGDIVKGDIDVQAIIERIEQGSGLTRKQRLFSTAFVKAVARRRVAEKKTKEVAASRFAAPAMKIAA